MTTTTTTKDLSPRTSILGGTQVRTELSDGYSRPNHNETLVRAKDLTPKGEVKGGDTPTKDPDNHNEILVRLKDLAPKAEIKGGARKKKAAEVD